MAERKSEGNTVTIGQIPSRGETVGGRLEMTGEVVATIAGIAARQVNGIHSLGKSRFISFGENYTRGVGVEVGQVEAALDLEVIIEYGCNIHETAAALRKTIADEVSRMAGRKVVEVNIKVVGIQTPEKKKEVEKKPAPSPRVK